MQVDGVTKVEAFELLYHVDHNGKRVTVDTCECYQCAMQHTMQTQLDAADRHYEREYVTDRASMARAARLRAERRQWVIDTFIKAGFVGCTMPTVIRVPMKIEVEQIEVARDAWQEDQGRVPPSERWREMLKEHPAPIQNYIGKRFQAERDELARLVAKAEAKGEDPPAYGSCFRITSLSYAQESDGKWAVTDNTPGVNHDEWATTG